MRMPEESPKSIFCKNEDETKIEKARLQITCGIPCRNTTKSLCLKFSCACYTVRKSEL